MTDLSNSVILPREDFLEMSQVAFDNQHVPSAGERTASVLQTTAVFGVMAGAIAAATWGYAKAIDWRDSRQHTRALEMLQFEIDNGLKS